MKGYSQKPTNGQWSLRGTNGRFVSGSELSGPSKPKGSKVSRHASSGTWTVKPHINKFEGMSENVEVISPVHIPGYKVRG